MRIILFTAALMWATQDSVEPGPLPMAEVEACQVEFSGPIATWGRWGGQVAVYDARADESGTLVRLERRIIDGREHLPPLVRLDQVESCVRRWRFDGPGFFAIALVGGTTSGGFWTITVTQGARAFRLRVPVAAPNR